MICKSPYAVVLLRRALPLLTALWFAGHGQVFAQAPSEAKLRVEKAEMLIGERNYLLITAPAQTSHVDLGYLDTLTGFWLAEDEPPQSGQVDGNFQMRIAFSYFDSAGVLLPALPVFLPGETLYTNRAALHIDMPRPDTTALDYRPLRKEPALLSDYLPWLLALGLVLLGLFLAWILSRNRRAAAIPLPVEPGPSPQEIALAELEKLRAGQELSDERYYTRLDLILRSYLEGQYRIPALERTSSELLELLRGHQLSAIELEPLLHQVDFVKFAQAELGMQRRQQDTDAVASFIKRSAARAMADGSSADLSGKADLS